MQSMNFKFISTVLLVFFTISYSHNQSIVKHYSRDNIPNDKIELLYKNVPVYKDSIISSFISSQECIELPKILGQLHITGTIHCQVLIDEDGELEAILIKRSVHQLLDEFAINSIKKYRFKKHFDVTGKKGKYSFLLPFKLVFK